ncbi:MAG: GGDEF domain-containing protein [Bacilli bacterium]|nr:GGDEF domain-containing protein [Bacilli bacterium]
MSSLEKRFGLNPSLDNNIVNKEVVDHSAMTSWMVKDIFSIYYVNLKNNNYVEYSSNDGFKTFDIEQSGEDFFKDGDKNLRKIIYPEDYEKVIAMFNKDFLLKSLENGNVSIAYRLLMDGKITYIRSTCGYLDDKKDHLLLCIKNADNEIEWLKKYERDVKKNISYSAIAYSLARDFFIIYYINIETDEFVEYSSNADYKQLKVEKSGTRFFDVIQGLIFRLAHPDDINKINLALGKEKIIRGLAKNKTYAVNFRIDYNGQYRYVRAKAIRVEDDDTHIVIGVSDVDAQVRAEQEYERAMQLANRDALTGVKSKYAYVIKEAKINESINNGDLNEFAVVVCDVNDLKVVNDNKGHQEGDKYLCGACQIICQTFKHSPVYRIGGDEFVALLTGQDYENREQLVKDIKSISLNNNTTEDAVVAVGISDYQDGDNLAKVFERADEAMYIHKAYLKENK